MVLKKSSQSLLPPIRLLACSTQITGTPRAAELGRQPVDRLDDASRRRHLGRTAWSAERVLHVDHDQRRAGRVQPIEQMVAAAPLQDAIDDFLADRDGMHDGHLSGQGWRHASPARSLTGPITLSKRMVMRSSRRYGGHAGKRG